jgi:chromosome segregation ATPase
MVKRILISVVLLSCFTLVFSQTNPDSIIVNERNSLFQTYSNEKASKPDPSKEDLINQISILESIINKDNVLIDSVLSYSKAIKELTVRLDTLSGSAILLSEKNSKSNDKANLFLYTIYGLSAAVIAFIILLIVLSAIRGKSAKIMKSKITELEEDKLKVDEELKTFETRLEDADSYIKRISHEKEEISSKLSAAENIYSEAKSEFQIKLNSFENESADLNSKINQLSFEKNEIESKANESESKLFLMSSENEHLRNKVNDLESANSGHDFQNKESYFQHQLEETTNLINQLVIEKSDLENKVRELENASLYKADNIELEELQAKIEEEKTQIERLTIEKTEIEQKATKLETELASLDADFKELEDDYYAIKDKLIEKEEIMEEYRKENNSDFYKKIDEVDLRVIKIEKLDRLFSKEVITKEEYDALKQKFLSEF